MSHFDYLIRLSLSFISLTCVNITTFSAQNSTDNHIQLVSECSLSLAVYALSLLLWLEWSPRSVLHQHWGYLCSRRWCCHLPLLSPGLGFFFASPLCGLIRSLLGACPVPCHLSLCCGCPLLDHFISFPPLSCSSAPSSDNWSALPPRMA